MSNEEIKKMFKKMGKELKSQGFDFIRCTMNGRQLEQRTATVSFFWEGHKETEKDGLKRMESLISAEPTRKFCETVGATVELDKHKDCGVIVWKLRFNY